MRSEFLDAVFEVDLGVLLTGGSHGEKGGGSSVEA
jgi:hypothetical protein